MSLQPNTKNIGTIPEQVTYIIRPPETVSTFWDNTDVIMEKSVVSPAFVSDSANAKTLKTGREWGNRSRYVHNQRDLSKSGYEPVVAQELQRDNTPIDRIQIIGLNIRDKGGRAYQVKVDDIYLFDLREDVLLDAIITDGIGKGGVLRGQYIWARVGSDMKLIRVGSGLHQRMIESTQFNKSAPIAESDLQVGRVYLNKKQDMFVFLGKMWTNEIKTESIQKGQYSANVVVESVGPREQVLVFAEMVFAEILDHWLNNLKDPSRTTMQWFAKKSDQEGDQAGDTKVYSLHIVRKHTFKVASEIVLDVPPDYIESYRNSSRWTGYGGRKYNQKTLRRLTALSSKEFNLSSERDYTHPLLVGVKPGDDLGPEYASADESYETIDPPRNYGSLGPFASLLRTP